MTEGDAQLSLAEQGCAGSQRGYARSADISHLRCSIGRVKSSTPTSSVFPV